MTIGNLGAARVPPKPGSAALNEALGLLAAFGGGDATLRTLLTEMRETQETNEQLLKDIGLAKSEVGTREVAALDAEAKARAAQGELADKTTASRTALEARAQELDGREAHLSGWASDLKTAQDSAEADLKAREDALKELDASISARSASIESDKAAALKEIDDARKAHDERVASDLAEIAAQKEESDKTLSAAKQALEDADTIKADAQARLDKLVALATGGAQ